MPRPSNGFSPQKEVRRSCRDRQAVYKSLDENAIGISRNSDLFRSLLKSAEQLRRQENREAEERERETLRSQYVHGYATRGRRPVPDDSATTEDDEDEEKIRRRRPLRRRERTFRDNDENEDSDKVPLDKRPAKRRRVVIEDDDDEPSKSHDESSRDNADLGPSMYERVKSRHQEGGTPETRRTRSMSQPPLGESSERSSRLRTRTNGIASKEAENNKRSEDEEEVDEEPEPRQYQLRPKRAPTQSYVSEESRSEKRANRMPSRVEEFMRRSRRRGAKRERLRRRDGASTDSTDTSDDGAGGARRKGKRPEHDEEKFERRKERSMQAARNRFLPINIPGRALSSEVVVRERLRQTGASCSDIDPMQIDTSVTFDQVGGLGAHIQSLKEVVLFPLLYPEIFSRFNINPPKGVVFYGPPGTGKTLVARALANECSQGDRKVAFFMRKGADCLSKWVGESERQLRLLFDQAYSMRPSIIFFDEIDGLAPVRSSRQDQIHSSIVSTLLALMDGLDGRGEVVVIGATNRLDTLDPALRRPGRFDRELKFNLPDAAARLQILEIHTEKWAECRPDAGALQWLADATSGFCGADLKFLCTESVLIALRARYPHIYMSKEKLLVDPKQIQVNRDHFMQAMRRITPASRRDMSIPSRPLDERTSILLGGVLNSILQVRIPSGYSCSQSVHNLRGCEHDLEKVVRALEEPPVVPHARLLLCGTVQCRDAGQSSLLLPSLLGRLDHLPIFSLAVGRLFVDGRPEVEALAQTMQSALRAAATGPALVLLPSVDQWFAAMPPSVSHMLMTSLDMLTGFTSILLLATCDCAFEENPEQVKDLFRPANAVQILPSPSSLRREYFTFVIVAPSMVPPKKFDASAYTRPPVASSSNKPVRHLNEKEAKELEKVYDGLLRQFRIFLRDMLARLTRDRRFNIFNSPVDEEDAQDYYQIITEPMCLTDMMTKIDRKEYTHPDQFLADVNLIMRNALEYNPDKDLEGKTIRHQAVALRDMAEALFDMELDEQFVQRLEDTKRLLKESGVNTVRFEELPFATAGQAARKKRFVDDEEHEEEMQDEAESNGDDDKHTVTTPNGSIRRRRRRHGNYSFSNKAKKRKPHSNGHHSGMLEDDGGEDEPEHELSGSGHEENSVDHSKANGEVVNGYKKEVHFEQISHNGEMSDATEEDMEEEEVFVCDEAALLHVVDEAVRRTEGWPAPELERLAASLAQTVDKYRLRWNRSGLPADLTTVIARWGRELIAKH